MLGDKTRELEALTQELTASQSHNQELVSQNEDYEVHVIRMDELLQGYYDQDFAAALSITQNENNLLKNKVTELENTLQDCRERLASFEGALHGDNSRIIYGLQQAGQLIRDQRRVMREVMQQAREVAHFIQTLAAEAYELREHVSPETQLGFRVHGLLQQIEILGIEANRYL